jgi:hypothetical protein
MLVINQVLAQDPNVQPIRKQGNLEEVHFVLCVFILGILIDDYPQGILMQTQFVLSI